jgi:hypothetical protein
MLNTDDLKSQYLNQGYIVIPLLNQNETQALREKILNEFNPGESGELYMDFYLKKLGDLDFYLNPKLLGSLKAIFPSIHYIPDLNIQINRIDQFGPKKGWHADCNYEDRQNQPYLRTEDYSCAKVGIYLQDDTLEYGGGIDIQPNSHRLFIHSQKNKIKSLYKKWRLSVSHLYPYRRLAIKAGHAVIFDSRLLHRSSSSSISLSQKDESKSKVVIYWNVTGSKFMAEKYYYSLIARAFDTGVPDHFRLFWENMLSVRFPDDFNEGFIEKANINNVNFWFYSKNLCIFFKDRTSRYGSKTGFFSSNFTSYPASQRRYDL